MQWETGSDSSQYVTPETAKELAAYLRNKSATVEVGAGKITASVTAKSGEALFMPFVASNGYEVTVNGKKVEMIENDLKLISVPLVDGENEVVITYSSPYVKYALLGLGGALVTLCAVAFVLKKTKLFDKTATVVSWMGIILSVAVTAFFMLYPTAVWTTKMVLAAPLLSEEIAGFFRLLF